MSEALIVRLPNWLGDTVMAVPALRALRRSQPVARIVAVGPWTRVLAEQGLVDAIVVYPRALTARMRLADTIRGFGARTAVLLPNALEAALSACYWGARRRVGFATDGRSWLLTERLALPSPRLHQIDEYLLVAAALGAHTDERVPRLDPLHPDSAERVRVRELLETGGALSAARPFTGIHLGAAYGSSKVWPADRVVELCQEVRRAGGTPILLGAPEDAGTAATIATAAEACVLAGRDGPDLVAAVLAEIDLLVSGDTGVAHLAAALGTPVVALFGPTAPETSAPLGPVTVMRHPVPCAPCFYRRCPIDHSCMRNIGAVEVMASASALLAEGARR